MNPLLSDALITLACGVAGWLVLVLALILL